MQQGLLQFVEGGELALVEGFEALGFFADGVEVLDDNFLILQGGRGNRIALQLCAIDVCLIDAGNHYGLAVVV